MLITAIIPSYKPREYLYECLDSIAAQDFPKDNFEAIVVLNGCNSPYLGDVQKYVECNLSSYNVRILQTDVLGVSNARNIGIDNANGEYITFLDDDDIISPNYFRCLFEVSSSDCVGCSLSYAFHNDINERIPNFLTESYNNCKDRAFSLYAFRGFLSPPWGKLINKNIIAENRFPVSLKKSEDSVFFMGISYRIKDMKLASDEAIYYQRVREGSAMRTKSSIIKEVKELARIEHEYVKIAISAPFRYNSMLLLSRMAAAIRNFIFYVKMSRG